MDETQIIVEQFFSYNATNKYKNKKPTTTSNIYQSLTFDPLTLACSLLLFLIRKVYVSVDIAMWQCID